MTNYETLRLFIQRKTAFPSSEWIYIEEHMQVYFRRSRRFIEGKERAFIDIANILTPEEYQGKGIFSRLLEHIETTYKHSNIYIENVLNQKLAQFLMKKGFKQVEREGYEQCYYKILRGDQRKKSRR